MHGRVGRACTGFDDGYSWQRSPRCKLHLLTVLMRCLQQSGHRHGGDALHVLARRWQGLGWTPAMLDAGAQGLSPGLLERSFKQPWP
ncbi:hypothetical protein Pnap_3804 [Polaromonas naphthalenivorans CJ2]|uniref:Uncharacterized protein n=1 Tax=Polaromonas naphthalenivorans (strain CJ2) TaxID=365044 RepID=A1VTX2_POLNA|nr:hypothetical protein Pnap_3804 [Polaromonas naphthalenivorans CJ2]